MTKEYKIHDLVTKSNKTLYEEVSKNLKITLQKMGFWASQTQDGQVIIGYTDSSYPSSLFTHELLHAKYYLKGLKMPKIDNQKDLTYPFFVFLFNQISHYKFFKEFCEMGFRKEEFLQDNDSIQVKLEAERVIPNLEKEFSRSGELKGSIYMLMQYVMLKSPHDTSETSLAYINRLRTIGNKDFFEAIDSILLDWTNQKSFDSCLTLTKLLKECNYENIGISMGQ